MSSSEDRRIREMDARWPVRPTKGDPMVPMPSVTPAEFKAAELALAARREQPPDHRHGFRRKSDINVRERLEDMAAQIARHEEALQLETQEMRRQILDLKIQLHQAWKREADLLALLIG